MNQTQRNFLIGKIKERVKTQIDALKMGLPESPNLANYLLHEVMSGRTSIIDNDEIKKIITKKAIGTKYDKSWLTDDSQGWSSSDRNKVSFKVTDFFILPDLYQKNIDEFDSKSKAINEQIRTLSIQSDTLITRIQLASNSTLDKMIKEVDDMGDLSLMDTKLKLIE